MALRWVGFPALLESHMGLSVPEDILKEAGVTERDALVELACRWFEAGRLSLPAATKFACIGRAEFENELALRGIAAYRPTVADLDEDLRTLKHLEELRLGQLPKGA